MANLNLKVILPPGFDVEETTPKVRKTLSAQKGVRFEIRENGSALIIIEDGTPLRSIQGAKLALDKYGIRFAVSTFNQETEEYIDDGSPLPDYADDCDCDQCRAARQQAERRRNARNRAAAQQEQQRANLVQQQQNQAREVELRRLLEEAVRTMTKAKKRVG